MATSSDQRVEEVQVRLQNSVTTLTEVHKIQLREVSKVQETIQSDSELKLA